MFGWRGTNRWRERIKSPINLEDHGFSDLPSVFSSSDAMLVKQACLPCIRASCVLTCVDIQLQGLTTLVATRIFPGSACPVEFKPSLLGWRKFWKSSCFGAVRTRQARLHTCVSCVCVGTRGPRNAHIDAQKHADIRAQHVCTWIRDVKSKFSSVL